MKILKYLLSLYCFFNFSLAFSFFSSSKERLFVAVSANDFKQVKYLINEKGVDPNVRQNLTQKNLLHEVRSLEIAEFLIEKGVGLNVLDGYKKEYRKAYGSLDLANDGQKSPLHYALIRGQTDIARLFILKGADVNVRDGFGQSPLYLAIGNHFLDISKLLVEYGADVHKLGKDKRTPLQRAIARGFYEFAEYLIKNTDVRLDVPDLKGRTATSMLLVLAKNAHTEQEMEFFKNLAHFRN